MLDFDPHAWRQWSHMSLVLLSTAQQRDTLYTVRTYTSMCTTSWEVHVLLPRNAHPNLIATYDLFPIIYNLSVNTNFWFSFRKFSKASYLVRSLCTHCRAFKCASVRIFYRHATALGEQCTTCCYVNSNVTL